MTGIRLLLSPVGSEVLAGLLRFDPQKSMLRSPARTSEPTGLQLVPDPKTRQIHLTFTPVI